jgi:excisionase family DNA binding protein
MTLLIGLTQDEASHLAIALQGHRKWLAASGLSMPRALTELQDMCVQRVSAGHTGSALADIDELLDAAVMAPRLLTYAAAGDALSFSLSTIKRLVASGELPAVRVAGTARIRVEDLDHFVKNLNAKESA